MGRPSSYNEDIANKICEEVVSGKSLNRITSDFGMPSIATVYAWFKKFPEFLKKYEMAKSDQIDTLVDEMLDIADNTNNDTKSVQRDRLRVDTRKWIAERMKPKKYGFKTEIEQDLRPIMMMPSIEVDGKELHFDVGERINKETKEM